MRWREIAAHLLGNKTLLFNNLGFAANTFVTTAMMTWLPSYFQRMEGISMSNASTKGGVSHASGDNRRSFRRISCG